VSRSGDDVDVSANAAGVLLAAALASGGAPRLGAQRVVRQVVVAGDVCRQAEDMVAQGWPRDEAEEAAACWWRTMIEDALAECVGIVLCPPPADVVP